MLIRTHLIGGACAGLLYIYNTAPLHWYTGALVMGITLAGSVFPDIDISTSFIGRKFKAFSTFINTTFGHRTLFHSPALYITFYLLLTHLVSVEGIFIGSFMVGVASHIFLDLFNEAGIPLLYPIPHRFSFGKIKAGSFAENIVAASLCLMLILEIVGLKITL